MRMLDNLKFTSAGLVRLTGLSAEVAAMAMMGVLAKNVLKKLFSKTILPWLPDLPKSKNRSKRKLISRVIKTINNCVGWFKTAKKFLFFEGIIPYNDERQWPIRRLLIWTPALLIFGVTTVELLGKVSRSPFQYYNGPLSCLTHFRFVSENPVKNLMSFMSKIQKHYFTAK